MTNKYQIEDYVDRNYDPAEQEKQNIHKQPRSYCSNTLVIGKSRSGKSKISLFISEIVKVNNVE